MGVSTVLLALLLLAQAVQAQPTRAEATAYTQTSSSADVWHFLHQIGFQPDTLAVTVEGRAVPLVHWVGEAPEVRVLVVANIHAGEVEGKEAVLALLRDGRDAAPTWARHLHLAVVPNLNPDGNDRIDVGNRPFQLGPDGGMGTRANAQGLDLNRDFVKLDSPEARGLVTFVREFDPHLILDLHATNGSLHGYQLTYAPGLHPATPSSITRLVREDLLPELTLAMRLKGWETEHYGNFPRYARRPVQPLGEIEWATFDYRPRFLTNYFALAGYPTILSEAYAYLSFEDRIRVTRDFVEVALHYAAEQRACIEERLREVQTPPDSVYLSATLGPAQPFTLLLAEVDEVLHPTTGDLRFRQRAERTPVEAQIRSSFVGQAPISRPDAYLISVQDTARLRMLALHGIATEPLPEGAYHVERFEVENRRVAERPFQGIHEVQEVGRYLADMLDAKPETWMRVPANGRDAALLVFLLEPAATDGFVTWQRASSIDHPVLRLPRGN